MLIHCYTENIKIFLKDREMFDIVLNMPLVFQSSTMGIFLSSYFFTDQNTES